MMAPRFPFSPLLLMVQVLYGGLGVLGIVAGEKIGWIPIIMTLLFTLYISGVYNESSTNPEHDKIINSLVALDIRAQEASWKNLWSNGGHLDEIHAIETEMDALKKNVELDHNGLYRWKR